MNNIDLSKYYVVPKTSKHGKLSGLTKREGTVTHSKILSDTRKSSISTSLPRSSMIKYKRLKRYVGRPRVDTFHSENSLKYFEPNHWKDELPQDYIYKIQHDINCSYSMKLLGYL